jgi:hypothetical protein
MKRIIHLHLVLRLKMCGAIPPLPDGVVFNERRDTFLLFSRVRNECINGGHISLVSVSRFAFEHRWADSD